VYLFDNTVSTSLQTLRQCLVPLTFSQLQLCRTNMLALEAELGLPISRDVLTKRILHAIKIKMKKMAVTDETKHAWLTYWLIIINESNFGAGLAGFKSYPDENGATEIGYGIDPTYQNRGYMSEAVKALVNWALEHPFCKVVIATTVENPASRRLLEKLGARLVTEDKTSSSWEIRK